jgi:hypothetical protein
MPQFFPQTAGLLKKSTDFLKTDAERGQNGPFFLAFIAVCETFLKLFLNSLDKQGIFGL